MGSISLLSLTTISQYALFLGIVLVLFGWFEKKERLAFAGQVIFILLGVFSLWILTNSPQTTPEINENLISKDVKIVSYMKLAVWFSAFNIISLILCLLKSRFYKASLFVAVVAGLALFFIVFNIMQTPANK